MNIKKTDDTTGAPLQGAVFSVVRASSGVEVGQITTDANGVASLSGLLYTDYTITEVTAPKGYILNTTPIPVTATDFDLTTFNAYVNVTNKAESVPPTSSSSTSTDPSTTSNNTTPPSAGKTVLPSTGDMASLPILLAGFMLLVLASFVVFRNE
ncbi:SpaA isopeptide-forming pilin-related protein [Streptococcus suis]|nr:SpaA isopeptide-forming pilin-related protein [Streptococcus suis]